MAHYAFLDQNNIVTEVIAGKHETDLSHDWEQFYGEIRNQVCKRTSYNNNIRKNYAGIGYTYDSIRDAFIPPKPYLSWLINEETCQWSAPIPMPVDSDKMFSWDEPSLSWVEIIKV